MRKLAVLAVTSYLRGLRVLASLLVVSTLCACSSAEIAYENVDGAAIKAEAMIMIKNELSYSSIEVDDVEKFKSIAALKPEKVYIKRDGVYVVMRTFGVGQRGLFVPRKGITVSTDPGTDPSYSLLKDGVYTYEIRG